MRHFLFSILALWSAQGFANNDLKAIANELVSKLETRNIERVAIWNFEPINGENPSISAPLTEDFSVHFLNASNKLKVYEREQLGKVIDELKLQHSGLIEQSTVKELGAFTGVEAIINGQYSIMNNKIKLWIKVIETESAYQIAALTDHVSYDYKSITKDKSINQLKKGSLTLKNGRSFSISVNVKNGDFSKQIMIGPKSKISVNNLTPGTYSCIATAAKSSSSFESFDIRIEKNKKSRYQFKPIRLIPNWLTIGLTSIFVVPIMAIGLTPI